MPTRNGTSWSEQPLFVGPEHTIIPVQTKYRRTLIPYSKSKVGLTKSPAIFTEPAKLLHTLSTCDDARPIIAFTRPSVELTGTIIDVDCVEVVYVWYDLWTCGCVMRPGEPHTSPFPTLVEEDFT